MKPGRTPKPASTRKHRTREARAFALTWTTGLIAGCIPGPASDRASINAIERLEYPATIRSETFTLSALRAGPTDAPRLIYVHGTPGDATAFADYILNPIEGFESISIDRPGFGKTVPASAVPGFADQAAAIEPLLVERSGSYPILVGHSLGGPIVARAAADYPDRVAGIVILAGSLDPALEEPRWFNHLAGTWPTRGLIGRTMRTSNDEIMAAVSETVALDLILHQVTCPVVIIHGTDDGLVPIANVDYMQRRFAHIENVRVIILENVGHFIPWSHEDLIREAIAELKATPPAPIEE